MRSWTYEEIKTKVQNDLDMLDEDQITADEWLGYYNEAVDEAEAEIHTLGRESLYFKVHDVLPVEEGENLVDLPSDIYANKIICLLYNNGVDKYEIKRIKDPRIIPDIQSEDPYRYDLVNFENPQVELHPAPRAENGPDNFGIYYIRNAARATGDDSVCDIPEFVNFIFAHMKKRALEKDSNPLMLKWDAETEKQRTLMTSTLADMVVDDDNQIPIDQSFYQDHQ